MFKQLIKRPSQISPHIAIIGALIVVMAGAGTALLLTRGGSKANVESLQPRAARIDRVDGSVGIARVENEARQLDWSEATVNMPVTVGDRVYARHGAHTSVALTGHNYVRLNSDSAFDVLTLEERRTQLALRDGSALFDVGALTQDDFYEVATPYGAVDFREPGLYQVGIDGDSAIISVLSGLAQVVGQGGSGYISKGQVFTLVAAAATQALASTLAPNLAGGIVDDYYRYRYPRVYDGRYRSYDAYLDDPFYYDPYRTSVSYQYLPADVPGLYDLDYYGDWVDVNNYGHCWSPHVSAGWAPFRSGYWDLDDLWGPSWVSNEPWGWAPYHYGRWAFINQRWFWVPAEVRTRPVYSPAAVAFIPYSDQIGWVPLGPGETYVPRYYDASFRPRYLASAEVINAVTVQQSFVNFNAPGAVTIVPVRAFTRIIEPGVIANVDPRFAASSRPVLDPFSVNSLRELAMRGDDGRRRMRLERREQEAFNRAVVTGATPEVFAVRGDVAKSLGVETIPEKIKKNKLRVEQAPQVTTVRPDGMPQSSAGSQRMAELATRSEQGDKSARREMRQLMREEQRGAAAQQQQAQQEQSRQQMKEQRKAERQQQAAAAAQQETTRQAQQQQMRQQRKAERQQQAAAAQQAQQQGAARRAQHEQMRQQQQQQMQQQEQMRQQQKQQQKQQKRARKPPDAFIQQQSRQAEQVRIHRAQQEAASQVQMAQREQVKAQKRAERQAMLQGQTARAQAAASQAITQQREQFKAQKRAERQAMMQQQAAQMQTAQSQAMTQQREQFKAQKRAEHQAMMQQQTSQPQAAGQRDAGFRSPSVRENTPSRAERKAEKAQRKQPQ